MTKALQLGRSSIRALLDRLQAQRDSTAFARSLGVTVGENVRFYGITRGMFGSEPWLIDIGDDVFITAGVQFVTHDGGTLILRREEPTLEWTAPIVVANQVYIGIRTIVLPGVTIGSRVIIGAGSVVTSDIEPNSVAVGVPARRISSVDDYKERMSQKSLGLGHLSGAAKDEALRAHFGR